MVKFTSPPFGTSVTARELKVCESRVRQFVALGLLPATRTAAGQLLFDPEDVRRFRDERARRRSVASESA